MKISRCCRHLHSLDSDAVPLLSDLFLKSEALSEEEAVCLPCLCQGWLAWEHWSVSCCACLFSLDCSFLWCANWLNQCSALSIDGTSGRCPLRVLHLTPSGPSTESHTITRIGHPGYRWDYELQVTVKICYKNIVFDGTTQRTPKEGSACPEFFSTCQLGMARGRVASDSGRAKQRSHALCQVGSTGIVVLDLCTIRMLRTWHSFGDSTAC